jgi:release factor glutamine methyltransferase
MTPPETIGSILGAVATALASAGFGEPRRRARRLLTAALGLSTTDVFAHLDRMVTDIEGERVAELLRRVLAHEPLSRILGIREFWGLEFELSADTPDPRPESETVVAAVIARLPERERPYRLLDLGTGTGCLLLALLSEFPAANGIGVDRAYGAAAAARRNAERLGFAARSGFTVGDWATALDGGFDAIVANPPYVARADIPALPREVHDFDPHLALDGGSDGLDAYRAIAVDLPRLLAAEGLFACEIGQGQETAVAGIISGHGLVVAEAVPDLAGIARCIVAHRPA